MRRAAAAAFAAGIGAAFAAIFLAAFGFAWLELGAPDSPIPTFAAARAAWCPSDARLLDRHGEVIQERRIDPSRRRLDWTPLDRISPALVSAVIASEDLRFLDHGGVDIRAIAGSALRAIGGAPLRGASTITMQLATLLENPWGETARPRTLARKWRQMRRAWTIEHRWTKREILEAYLNLATFRGELQGVAAASGAIFGKSPHGLLDAESLVLAVLLRAPGAGRAAIARRAQALEGALGQGTDRAALAGAVARAVDASGRMPVRVALAPHAGAILLRPRSGAITVRSTLDADLQRFAEETLRRQLVAMGERRVRDGAVLVVENRTGDVLAYVGGSGALSSARHVDGVRARRQAGSSLKPFLYGLAFERRILTPASILEDSPLDVPVAGGLYRPRNYDETFLGPVSARTALASSLNVPAVRTLALVGEEAFARRLRDLGFGGLTEAADFYGPALALGSTDVSLWELVGAYRALAEGGLGRPLRMTDPGGPPPEGRRAFAEEAVFLVSSILSDRESRSATFGLESPLATRAWTAVKTGTSKAMRDNWCLGYSRRYTVGVWVGNFSGEPMRDVSGVTGAAPVWSEVMERLEGDAPGAPPDPPGGVILVGGHASGGEGEAPAEPTTRAEQTAPEWFLRGTEPDGPPHPSAAPLPAIVAPAPGSIIALDPDIPPDRQRLVFEAQGSAPGMRWVLDGKSIARAAGPFAWAPRAGRHRLALVDAAGRRLDTVTFEVRGDRRT